MIRSLAFVVGLMSFAAVLEAIVPMRRRTRSRVPNLLLTVVTFALTIGLSTASAWGLAIAQAHGWGFFAGHGVPAIVLGVTTVAVLDLATYFAHRAMHAVPFLWRVHRLHHADPFVDVSTAFRQHPMEGVWRSTCVLIPALVLGLPPEAIAVYRLFSASNALFEHANVKLWPPLERVLSFFWVTPGLHKIHHSRERPLTDSAYGNLFSFFDRLFGTAPPPVDTTAIDYGLS